MTIKTSTAATELALTIIHDGRAYTAMCHLAARKYDISNYASPSIALAWMEHARLGAARYCYTFPGVIFTPADILGCALELAEYYEGHIKEIAEP